MAHKRIPAKIVPSPFKLKKFQRPPTAKNAPVAQPTRGLDVGAIEFIHQYLVELRNQGKAVLLISFQLDEVMDLSDRICVIYDGQIVGELDPKETDEYEVGRLMAGGDHE